jgi:hypothetical protein
MRNLLNFSIVSLVAAVMFLALPPKTLAHDHTSPIHQSMKQLGILSKQVAATVGEPSQNQANAENAKKMIELFHTSFDHASEAVEDLPVNEQPGALLEIQNMISQEIEMASDLEEAFIANDNAAAKIILKKMVDLKEEGHDKYKP